MTDGIGEDTDGDLDDAGELSQPRLICDILIALDKRGVKRVTQEQLNAVVMAANGIMAALAVPDEVEEKGDG